MKNIKSKDIASCLRDHKLRNYKIERESVYYLFNPVTNDKIYLEGGCELHDPAFRDILKSLPADTPIGVVLLAMQDDQESPTASPTESTTESPTAEPRVIYRRGYFRTKNKKRNGIRSGGWVEHILTIAATIDYIDGTMSFGWSLCSPGDNFSKKIGRELALERLRNKNTRITVSYNHKMSILELVGYYMQHARPQEIATFGLGRLYSLYNGY